MMQTLIPYKEWPDLKQYGKGAGKMPVSTIGNLQFLLSHLQVHVKYNVITKDLEIFDPNHVYGSLDGGKNAAINAVLSICSRYGLPKDNVPGYLEAIGYKNQYNPVLDWIESRPYDHDINYVEMLCETITARADFNNQFKNLLIKKWLLSCVAMLCNDDGLQWSKGVLTFQGKQNLGKTSWFWKLFPEDHREWGEESLVLNPAEKDSITTAIRNWIVELGELEATFKKSDIARIKGFLTKRSDTIRMPYDRKESTFPRRTSFFASVNTPEFLHDMTGNSRFWVIPVIDIDYGHEIDMQQMWAQIYGLYKSGYEWNLTHDQDSALDYYNEFSREMHPIEEKILSTIVFGTYTKMTATQVLEYIGWDHPTKSDVNVCSNVLRNLYGDSMKERTGRYFDVSLSRRQSQAPFDFTAICDRPKKENNSLSHYKELAITTN